MTTDSGAQSSGSGAHWNQTILDAMREASGKGNGGLSALRTLISKARLTPEQEAVVDLLFSLQNETEAEDEEDLDLNEDDLAEPLETSFDHDPEFDGAKTELADLREVNDTLAAALGACPLCWGGDRTCACKGLGQVGFEEPDLELFNELIVPAVKRVSTLRRAGKARPSRSRR